MLFDKIKPLPFMIAFAIGIFICYLTNPIPELIVKFPSPESAGNVVYRDKMNNCFVYKANSVTCPLDKSKIKAQPVTLEDFQTRID